jgi:hypothetical protein
LKKKQFSCVVNLLVNFKQEGRHKALIIVPDLPMKHNQL